MDSTNRLLNVISKVSPDTISELSLGTVTSVNPLIITRESGAANTPITAGFLILPRSCRRYVTEHDTHWYPSGKRPNETPNAGDHNHKIEIEHWTDLQIGERVILLSFNSNQKYYVARIDP